MSTQELRRLSDDGDDSDTSSPDNLRDGLRLLREMMDLRKEIRNGIHQIVNMTLT
jgi:hypothetical protein